MGSLSRRTETRTRPEAESGTSMSERQRSEEALIRWYPEARFGDFTDLDETPA